VNTAHLHKSLSYQYLAGVLSLLLVLTGVTVGVSSIDLGTLNVWVAVLIASIKSSLVLLYFMNLKQESSAVRFTFLVTVVTLALLIGFIFWDLSFR
jgi:cytochrome c oxidase subunit 4